MRWPAPAPIGYRRCRDALPARREKHKGTAVVLRSKSIEFALNQTHPIFVDGDAGSSARDRAARLEGLAREMAKKPAKRGGRTTSPRWRQAAQDRRPPRPSLRLAGPAHGRAHGRARGRARGRGPVFRARAC